MLWTSTNVEALAAVIRKGSLDSGTHILECCLSRATQMFFGMSKLVATVGDARRRALMIIFGRGANAPRRRIAVCYESQGAISRGEAVRGSSRVIALPSVVV